MSAVWLSLVSCAELRCFTPAILIVSMSETKRTETQLGVADLTKRLGAAGIHIIDQHKSPGLQRSTYFAIGSAERQTDITISDTFLDDLPNTKEYQATVD